MPTGTLIVQTRAARGALPVVGATVTVYCPDANGVLQPCITERTDMSGSTPPIELETPSLENTSPEAVPPFATYRVDIDHPDYRPVTVLDVAMFSGIPTTLPVVMTPPR
uniref:spore cortex-lytic protein n=1 Tax=Butyricicoccus sp. TaxID=2049021 RepID=UPI003735B157